MIPLQTYLSILVAIGAISLAFILRVFLKQVRLLKVPFEGYDEKTQAVLKRFRLNLFGIVVAILVISTILGLTNIAGLLFETGRPGQVSMGSFWYSLGIHILLLLLSYLVARLYTLASNEKDITKYTVGSLKEEKCNS